MSQASLSNLCHPERSEAPAERTKDPSTANGIPKAASLSITDPKKHDSRRMKPHHRDHWNFEALAPRVCPTEQSRSLKTNSFVRDILRISRLNPKILQPPQMLHLCFQSVAVKRGRGWGY